MIRRFFVRFSIILVSFLFAFLLVEVAIRIMGETDVDGQFYFMGRALPPYTLSVQQINEKVENYLDDIDKVTLVYEPLTGWQYRPNATRQKGDFTINGIGIRSHQEFTQDPLPDTIRIALFGDSFTATEDVTDDEAWSALLVSELQEAGIRAEVLNFGVGGYGMDQAFLRWQHLGSTYQPDIVLFGFQPENLNRNVNLFRPIYLSYTSLPLSKPRFVLNNGELKLLNSPAIPPDELTDVYTSFHTHPLSAHEYYYQSRFVASQWWAESKFMAFLYAVLVEEQPGSVGVGPNSDRGILGQAIVDAFATDVQEHGAEFFVLHIPRRDDMQRLFDDKSLNYQFLLDHFNEAYHYIPLEDHLDPKFEDEAYWSSAWHYGVELNQLVAEVVADSIQDCIERQECDLPRFEDLAMFYGE